jgi:hypothetical protein
MIPAWLRQIAEIAPAFRSSGLVFGDIGPFRD